MPECKKCGKIFPNHVKVQGKIKNLQNRKFCLECSPYGKHNTVDLLKNSGDERWCPKCKSMKLKINFYKRKRGGEYSYCKKCFNELCTERQQQIKLKCIEYMGGKCRCGYNQCVGALEFHHKDPTQKDPKIRFGNSRVSFKKIEKELDKCIMLCANCHREEHEKIRMAL